MNSMMKALVTLQFLTIAAIAGLFVVQSGNVENLRADLKKLEDRPAAAPAPAPASGAPADLTALENQVGAIRRDTRNLLEALKMFADDFEFLMVDVDAVKRNTWDLLEELKASGRVGQEPEPPAEYRDLFNPETRQALVERAAERGVTLLDDRVLVPGVVIQDRAMLEFFAVITGGKEHEAVVALTGNHDPEKGRLPEGLAGMINACILALGYERGEPVSVTPDGKVVPPSGETIHIYMEWDEKGETVRARAEDLIYDLDSKRAMERGKWVYVGSRFERDFGAGTGVVYMADITGDVVATYSWPNTIIDNTTLEAKDDIYYVCYTPRIPKIGTKATVVFSKTELPAREFEEGGMEEEDGGDSGK
jgi:hypothetical protein